MKTLVESTAFRKDLKRAKKRSYDREKLDAVIQAAIGGNIAGV